MFLAVSTFSVNCVVQEDWVSHEKATTSNHEAPDAMSSIRPTSFQWIGGGNVLPNRLQCPRRSLPTAQKARSRSIPPQSHVTGWERTARARKPIPLLRLIIHRVNKTLQFLPFLRFQKLKTTTTMTGSNNNNRSIFLRRFTIRKPQRRTTSFRPILPTKRNLASGIVPQCLARIDVCISTMPAYRVHGAGISRTYRRFFAGRGPIPSAVGGVVVVFVGLGNALLRKKGGRGVFDACWVLRDDDWNHMDCDGKNETMKRNNHPKNANPSILPPSIHPSHRARSNRQPASQGTNACPESYARLRIRFDPGQRCVICAGSYRSEEEDEEEDEDPW